MAGCAACCALASAQGATQAAQLAGHCHLAERCCGTGFAVAAFSGPWIASCVGCRPHRGQHDHWCWGQRHW